MASVEEPFDDTEVEGEAWERPRSDELPAAMLVPLNEDGHRTSLSTSSLATFTYILKRNIFIFC